MTTVTGKAGVGLERVLYYSCGVVLQTIPSGAHVKSGIMPANTTILLPVQSGKTDRSFVMEPVGGEDAKVK